MKCARVLDGRIRGPLIAAIARAATCFCARPAVDAAQQKLRSD